MGPLRGVALGVLTAIGISVIVLFVQSVGDNNISTTSFQTTSINVIITYNSDSIPSTSPTSMPVSTSQPILTTTNSTTSTSTSKTTIITEAATPIWNEQLGVES